MNLIQNRKLIGEDKIDLAVSDIAKAYTIVRQKLPSRPQLYEPQQHRADL